MGQVYPYNHKKALQYKNLVKKFVYGEVQASHYYFFYIVNVKLEEDYRKSKIIILISRRDGEKRTFQSLICRMEGGHFMMLRVRKFNIYNSSGNFNITVQSFRDLDANPMKYITHPCAEARTLVKDYVKTGLKVAIN